MEEQQNPTPEEDAPKKAPARWYSVSLRNLVVLLLAVSCGVAGVILYASNTMGCLCSEVTRAKADLRAMATALESYFIDNGAYPPCGAAAGPQRFHADGTPIPTGVTTANSHLRGSARQTITFQYIAGLHPLTTPIAYLTTYKTDPHADKEGTSFGYYAHGGGWILWGMGPDHDEDADDGPGDLGPRVETLYDASVPQPSELILVTVTYDSTNGTNSSGDVYRMHNPRVLEQARERQAAP